MPGSISTCSYHPATLAESKSATAAGVTVDGTTVATVSGSNAGVVFGGELGSGAIPVSGAGTRMMWYPGKSAFQAGTVKGPRWDDANVGDFSIASGFNTEASGENSTAMGWLTTASGDISTAMGIAHVRGEPRELA